MLQALKLTNLGASFLLELAMLGALAYWGFTIQASLPVRIALAIGAPLVAAVVWGLLLAPRATIHLDQPVVLALKVVVFGLAFAGLAVAGQSKLAAALGVAVVLNLFLAYLWQQEP